MKKNNKNNKLSGFTLVEVLVAVGAVAVGSLAFLPSFNKVSKQKNIEQSVENVKDAIATARNRALTETNNPGQQDQNYRYSGVKFTRDSSTYQLFRSVLATEEVCSNLSSSGVVVDATKSLLGGTVVKMLQSESPICIFFEYGTGNSYITKKDSARKSCSD